MAFFDLPLVELERYQPERFEPTDFDSFWEQTLDEVRRLPLQAEFTPVDYGLAPLHVEDARFAGYGGQTIKGWFLRPSAYSEPLPCIVEYIGYGGGRGLPYNWLNWSACGYAHLVMDTRGQGSAWLQGDTPDQEPEGSSPHYPGFMTRGVLDPHTYYYRRLIVDAVRAVEAAQTHPAVDPSRVAVTGRSQGGGLALIVAGLVPDLAAAMPDVPFLCHYRRATELVDTLPYFEITRYCRAHRDQVERVFTTLSYFDGLNFAARAQTPALFSAGLMDEICPPSTVFAAYNHYAGPKQMRTYPYNEHDGGGAHHIHAQVQFLKTIWGSEG